MRRSRKHEITGVCLVGSNSSVRRGQQLVAALALLLLAGCVAGPDFQEPMAPDVDRYTVDPLPAMTASTDVPGGEAQHFIEGSDIVGDWWTLFHSEPLSALIEESIANNHDLKAAQAALLVARENVLAQRGAYYPSVAAGLLANRFLQPQSLAPVPNYPEVPHEFQYNLFTPQVSVSYVPDVFGRNRRTVESLAAQAQQARFQMIATYTVLTANVVVAAIEQGSLQRQIEATHELIDTETKILEIVQYQYEKGYASGLDLAAQRSQLAQTTATLPPLMKQSAQLSDLLAALVGRFPSQAPADEFDLSTLQLPRELPVSLPSALVEQRPDVRQAEENMHAASAGIGIAIADRLPDITLSASAGSIALAIDRLFASGNGFWALGAELTVPIFQGGSLLHEEQAARAAYVQAAEQYRGTVLTAFQNVADTLAALAQDAEALKAAAAALDAAKVTLDLAQTQLRDGYASELSLLNAEQTYQQAQITLVNAQADRYADTAALFQALGGGWWHREDLADDSYGK
jgi:NodT family efflux transporter outer membrane factor (OMF) lipoprotein